MDLSPISIQEKVGFGGFRLYPSVVRLVLPASSGLVNILLVRFKIICPGSGGLDLIWR